MSDFYDPKKIEAKWQRFWLEKNANQTGEPTGDRPKKYVLDMFPYPSGEGLHVGHVSGYTATDVLTRFYRMKNFAVLHPMGWDAFGLPAENYALKKGVPPKETTAANIINFRKQIDGLGLSYDWERELNTSSPEYYRWTQWLFLQLYDKGLAYQAAAKVNWCEHDQTVLANEQVIDGKCERCKQPVVQKEMTQWFFKITEYAQELLDGLEELDWPESIKTAQRNWIGRSEGARLSFDVQESEVKIEVFTTRPDTLLGATYLVLSPENPLVPIVTTEKQKAEVVEYQEKTKKKTELERTFLEKEKTGVFTGAYAINPANDEPIPIWIADYVLMDYGTGAIMAVPAHDERDQEFAQKDHLPIKEVEADGSQEAKTAITEKVGGEMTVTYRLRDWLISRQRYWGAPIPIIHCDTCGVVPVPESDLPVTLPDDVDFKPHGHSPLADSPSFNKVKCPKCQKPARRESDTMDTFVCSSWYYLRYVSPQNKEVAFDSNEVKKWLPVDIYVGGAEHAVLHLLYSRFITRFLRDQKLLDFDEPFTALHNIGLILGPDHAKMSKSRGNVVNPDEIVDQYGADVLRLHELFMGPFSAEKPWSTETILGPKRFLEDVWRQVQRSIDEAPSEYNKTYLETVIAKVGADTAKLKFNTAISAMMTFINLIKGSVLPPKELQRFILILFPYAPHLASEMWQLLDGQGELYEQSWPDYDQSAVKSEEATIVVQVNGRMRGSFVSAIGTPEEELKKSARNLASVQKHLEGKEIARVITVPDRLVNFVLTD